MKIKPIIAGTAVGMVSGAVCYMAVKAPGYKKRALKRRTARAVSAVSDMVGSLSGVLFP